MLCINGYSNSFLSFLGIVPPKGRKYWAKEQGSQFFVLKDFNCVYIDTGAGFLSTAGKRYRLGYDYARKNLDMLRSHILLSGNRLQIVAHSHGVAFAEGIAAYLYEEQMFVTDLLIALQSCQAAQTPQLKKAVNCRVELKTTGDFIVNRQMQKLNYSNIEITETALPTGFVRYRILQTGQVLINGAEYIYLRKKIPLLKRHMASRTRQFEIWTAINHALAVYNLSSENTCLFSPKHIQPEVLKQYAENQN